MSGIEHATRSEQQHGFPSQWTVWNGPPPQDEACRAGWIRANLAEGEARRASGERIGWLHKTTGREAMARLEYRRTDPGTAARARLALLNARRTGP